MGSIGSGRWARGIQNPIVIKEAWSGLRDVFAGCEDRGIRFGIVCWWEGAIEWDGR